MASPLSNWDWGKSWREPDRNDAASDFGTVETIDDGGWGGSGLVSEDDDPEAAQTLPAGPDDGWGTTRPVQHYAGGGPVLGAIDEDTGEMAPAMGGSGFGGQLTAALKAVNAALMFGRQRYGLVQQQQQQAMNRMPTVPGTQSESGRRQMPMPGPLPPTNNPFGKRVEAAPEEEPAEEEAIETDEETA